MGVQKKQPFGNFMPKRTDIQKILIIGSGPIVIGQACEFDYSGTQACKALREEGYQVILVNSNPATIMTDPEFADVTYIEPRLRVEQLFAEWLGLPYQQEFYLSPRSLRWRIDIQPH